MIELGAARFGPHTTFGWICSLRSRRQQCCAPQPVNQHFAAPCGAAVTLLIIDGGLGFDAPPAGYPRLGLRPMDNRVRSWGAVCALSTHGAAVRASR